MEEEPSRDVIYRFVRSGIAGGIDRQPVQLAYNRSSSLFTRASTASRYCDYFIKEGLIQCVLATEWKANDRQPTLNDETHAAIFNGADVQQQRNAVLIQFLSYRRPK